MKNKLLVRCVACGNVYEKGLLKSCSVCHCEICDNVLMAISMLENRVIVDFSSLMRNYPKVFGLQITGNN